MKRIAICDHREGNVGGRCNFTGRVGPPHPFFNQPLRLRLRTIETDYGMAFVEKPAYHLAPHHSKTDKPQIRHCFPSGYKNWLASRNIARLNRL
jgi:hypothetical protein